MNMKFTDKRVSVKGAIAILAKNGIEVEVDETTVIFRLPLSHSKQL